MSDVSKEEGLAYTSFERFEQFRLPRALEIKERIDSGEKLTDNDIAFLEQVMQDAEEMKRLVQDQPEYEQFCARAVGLYQGITKKAPENEQHSKAPEPCDFSSPRGVSGRLHRLCRFRPFTG